MPDNIIPFPNRPTGPELLLEKLTGLPDTEHDHVKCVIDLMLSIAELPVECQPAVEHLLKQFYLMRADHQKVFIEVMLASRAAE